MRPCATSLREHDPAYEPSYNEDGSVNLAGVKGLVWRRDDEIVLNLPRPFIQSLDDLPIPMHESAAFEEVPHAVDQRAVHLYDEQPGLPGRMHLLHQTRQLPVQRHACARGGIVDEMKRLKELGIHNIHMYADLFTVNREQVMGLCQLMIDENLNIRWTCNSRVDYVDEEMLRMMGKAGNWLISWGIESGNEQILKHARKGAYPDKAERALRWAKAAGIKNWGYFIIGLPGETEATIRQTIDFAKKLPLDIALFHVAAPYPGTPFFFEVVENGWFRPGTRWEQVDMDKGTVLDYPDLPAERLLYWQKRAFREWAFRPGPVMTYLKMLLSDWSTLRSAVSVGMQHLSWVSTDSGITRCCI